MGMFSKFKESWKKSDKINILQKKIASIPSGIDVAKLLDFDPAKEKQLMEAYLNLCISDEGVAHVMHLYSLNKDNLYQYYIELSAAGLGRWVKGHYLPLSTIAYFESLLYLVEAKKREINYLTILGNLLQYWEGGFPHGGLLAILEKEHPFLDQFAKNS